MIRKRENNQIILESIFSNSSIVNVDAGLFEEVLETVNCLL